MEFIVKNIPKNNFSGTIINNSSSYSYNNGGSVLYYRNYLELKQAQENIKSGVIKKSIESMGGFGSVNSVNSSPAYFIDEAGFIFSKYDTTSGTTSNIASLDNEGNFNLKSIRLINNGNVATLNIDENGNLYTDKNFYSTGEISAHGLGDAGSGSGGNIIIVDNLTTQESAQALSAKQGYILNNRLTSIEGGSATSVDVTGTGNAITNLTKSGAVITATKDKNFSQVGHNHLIGNIVSLQTTLNGKSGTGHTHTKANITDFPASMPASDVYAWAKAATKPTYTFSEIGSKPTTLSGYGITDLLALSNHTHYQLYQPNGVNPFVYTDNASNLFVNGNIIQSGTTWETHANKIFTSGDTMILRDGAASGLAANKYVGLVAKKYDGVNDGVLVFDNNGFARVGDMDITAWTGTTQALATREDAPLNGGIAYWDSATYKFKTALASTLSVSNSDLLDNQHGAYYLDYNNFTNKPILNYLSINGGVVNGNITASSFIKSGGASTQFLMADGTTDTYGTTAGSVAEGNHTHTFASLTSKPTTIGGYGITDAYTKLEGDKLYLQKYAYSFTNGCLVMTDIYAWDSIMCTAYIKGYSYPGNINTQVTFYSYNNSSIVVYSGIHYGEDIGDIKAFIYNNRVCLWFKQKTDFQSFEVIVNTPNNIQGNRVTTITNEAEPAGATRTVTITPVKSVKSVDLPNILYDYATLNTVQGFIAKKAFTKQSSQTLPTEQSIYMNGTGGSTLGESAAIGFHNPGISYGSIVHHENSFKFMDYLMTSYIPVMASTGNFTKAIVNDDYCFTGEKTHYIQNLSAGDIAFKLWNGSSDIIPLTVKNTGNVGIGTTDPQALLQVGGGTNNGIIRLKASSYDWWDLQSTYNYSNPDLIFSTSTGEKLRINAYGNVGLGYTGDMAGGKLLVNGNVGIGTATPFSDITISGNRTLSFEQAVTTNADTRRWWLGNDIYAYGDFALRTSSTKGASSPDLTRIYINSFGNVGIGTTSPQSALDIQRSYGNDVEIKLTQPGSSIWSIKNTATTGLFSIGSGGALHFNINNSTGNVGIGTTTPNASYKLDVVGTTNSSVSTRSPKFDLGNGWDFRAVGSELQVFYNGVKKGAFTETGFISEGEVTAKIL